MIIGSKTTKLLILGLILVLNIHAQEYDQSFQNVIDSFYQTHPESVGIMIDIKSTNKNISWNYAVGYSNKTLKTPIDPTQPALIASITKTFVSATILKLVELNKLTLEQPIDNLIKKKSNKLLVRAGYKTQDIKIKHILSHTSGIVDFVSDDYHAFVNTHKEYHWTRDEQIKLATTNGNPLTMPGDTFKYADVNYLLASEIIESITKKPYYNAVTELLEFKKHNLYSTWFVTLQNTPEQSKQLVHQYYNKYPWDSYELNPSWDLYGGGGMAASTKDLTTFFTLLFEGEIIKDTNLLSTMCTPVSTKTNYGLGIRRLVINGHVGYYHGGWWGTDAIYFPELKTAIAIFVLERSEKEISRPLLENILKIVVNE